MVIRMFSRFTIPKNWVLSFRGAALVAAIIALSIGSGVAQAQYNVTSEELRVGSAWSSKAISVVQEFGEAINLTAQLDEISEGILSGEIKSDFANRQYKNLLATILLKFNNARKAAKQLGTPPTFRDERLKKRIETSFEMLPLAENAAKKLIEESGQLFIEAKAGNQDAVKKLNEKSLRSYSSLLGLQNGLLSGQMATFHSNEATYYHYKGMFETYSALISGLNSILQIFKSGSVDTEMLDSGHKSLEVAKSTYIIGRRILKTNINKYSVMKASTRKEKSNKQILLKAFKSIYETFNVEEEIIIVVEKFLNTFRQSIYRYKPEDFDKISIEMQILENKRHNIMISRQNMIAGIK